MNTPPSRMNEGGSATWENFSR